MVVEPVEVDADRTEPDERDCVATLGRRGAEVVEPLEQSFRMLSAIRRRTRRRYRSARCRSCWTLGTIGLALGFTASAAVRRRRRDTRAARVVAGWDAHCLGSEPFSMPGGPSATQIWTAAADGSGAKPLIGGLRNGLFQIVWPRPDTLLDDANFQVVRAGRTGRTRSSSQTRGSRSRRTRTVTASPRAQPGATARSSSSRSRPASTSRSAARAQRTAAPRFRPTGRASRSATLSTTRRRISTSAAACGSERERKTLHRIAKQAGRGLVAGRRSDRVPVLGSLRTIAPAGTHGRVLVTKGPVCSVPTSVAWSPDGKRIAYIDAKSGRLALLEVASRHTTTVGAFASVTGVAWSPD